ncbi:MAG: dihydrolipoamide acetyltransferase family protein [Acidobacteria bacterium]|nr:dihydrolipoamide acetyltransferase family protein [Acidobacteriota bacterium]
MAETSAAATLKLPDLGEGLHEAEIVSWHVSEGDHVVTDQPLVSVETDKAVVEIPSPHAGHIRKLCGSPGERIAVGAVLVEFEAGGGRTDRGAVVGDLAEAPPTSAADAAPGAGTAAPVPGASVRAVPAVRALARRLGVDVAQVQGTGPRDAVTRADVERAAQALADAGPPEALRGVRRAMAERMARAHAEVVPASLTDEADVDGWPEGTTVLLRLIRAVVAGCRAAPALNAWFDGEQLTRRVLPRIDLGVAVDIEESGLFVPVMRDVGGRSQDDLAAGIARLKEAVRARSIPPEALRGQTITLSNFGSVGGRHAALVVVPPQVAILGAGRVEPRVVAVGAEPGVHRVLPLSLTFDHRAVTGAEAARFLRAVVADLEAPAQESAP